MSTDYELVNTYLLGEGREGLYSIIAELVFDVWLDPNLVIITIYRLYSSEKKKFKFLVVL